MLVKYIATLIKLNTQKCCSIRLIVILHYLSKLMIVSFNIWILIFVGLLLIASFGFIVFLLKGFKKNAKFRELLVNTRKDYKSLKNDLLEESKNVERHQEELLAQTEHLQLLNVELERLSLVASETDTAVTIADHEGMIFWVNEGFVKQFGYSLTEYISKFGTDVFAISRHANNKPMVEEAIRNKRSLNYSSRVQTKSGQNIWIKTTINPIYDEYGNVKQFIVLETDISELKSMNDKLKKLSLVASKTSNAVMIYNSDEELDWVNEGFYNMYGYSKEEYIANFGNEFSDFSNLNNKKTLQEKLISEKKSVSFIGRFTDAIGLERWKQIIVTPVFDEKNALQNYIVVESDITRIKEVEAGILEEKAKVDQLLLNILPEETAEELKSKGKATPRFYRSASVLFADIQDFTKLAENLTPEELVHDLQSYFSRFDDAVSKYFVEKIKTMGDAFLCVGGIPMKNKSHPFDTVLVGLELQRIIKELARERVETGVKAWNLRIGIHTGPIVAGVVGKQKMTYDIWGDSVNISKRIESACVPGMVNVSGSTYEIIKDYFECEHRGKILAKNKGQLDMYFVHKLKPEFSEKGDGIVPNHYFQEMLARL